MEILGHSQIAVTMNMYTKVVTALKRDAADRIDELVGDSGFTLREVSILGQVCRGTFFLAHALDTVSGRSGV